MSKIRTTKQKDKTQVNQQSILSFLTNNKKNDFSNLLPNPHSNQSHCSKSSKVSENEFEKSTNFNSIQGQANNDSLNNFSFTLNNSINLNLLREDCNPMFIGKMYYPSDKELYRQYQFDIVKTSLIQNTLVCIPTGLGKTFIASVIMYNYHLWFKGKIFFLAPTKPLVNQQVSAFNRLFKGLKSVEITGKQSITTRKKYYSEYKIFFMTPQTLDNDLKNCIVQTPEDTSLVIFDEAHKAQKNYSYVGVVNKLTENKGLFRIIGLTASPGTNRETVQNVIDSLRITAVELRTEQDEEIKKFSHEKKIQIAEIEEEKSQININKLLDRLLTARLDIMKKFKVVERKVNPSYLTIWFIINCRDKFKNNIANFEEEYGKPMVSEIFENFNILQSLARAKKLLITQGAESLKKCITDLECPGNKKKSKNMSKFKSTTKSNNLTSTKEYIKDDIVYSTSYKNTSNNLNSQFTAFKKTSKARENLINHKDFIDLKYELFERVMSTTEKKNTLHPKLKMLHEIIRSNQISLENSSKAIIFTQFKDSAREINDFLNSKFSKIPSEIFHGQDKNFKQKDQLDIMKKFRDGDVRVLVSTSVAEEGLDIGEVDLIICYDMMSSSPIRMIQRFGRTGRKRNGVVIVLASKGDEKNKYFQCLNKLRHLNDELRNLSSNFRSSNIKLYSGELNLAVPSDYIKNIEYFEITSEIIDNADDFYYDSSENEEENYSDNDSVSSLTEEVYHTFKKSSKKNMNSFNNKSNVLSINNKHCNIENVIEEFHEENKSNSLHINSNSKHTKNPFTLGNNNINSCNSNNIDSIKPTGKKCLNFNLFKKPVSIANPFVPSTSINNVLTENNKISSLMNIESTSVDNNNYLTQTKQINNEFTTTKNYQPLILEENSSFFDNLFSTTNKKNNNPAISTIKKPVFTTVKESNNHNTLEKKQDLNNSNISDKENRKENYLSKNISETNQISKQLFSNITPVNNQRNENKIKEDSLTKGSKLFSDPSFLDNLFTSTFKKSSTKKKRLSCDPMIDLKIDSFFEAKKLKLI